MADRQTTLLEAEVIGGENEKPAGGAIAKSPAPAADDFLAVVERLAANPQVDVEKLERIIALQEKVININAKAAFDAAFAKMQAELPEVMEDGRILNKDGTSVRSRYAKLEDIQKAVRPALKAHGFALRHRTEWPPDRKVIRIVGILSHEQGHSEESAFEAPMDKSDYRTEIQSMGSTVSYGRRYTTIDLLNISTRGVDNDGQTGKAEPPKPPNGYEKWVLQLKQAATKGHATFDPAWECSDADLKNYAVKHDRETVAALKKAAATASRGAK